MPKLTTQQPLTLWEILSKEGVKQVRDTNSLSLDQVLVQIEERALPRARAISMGAFLGLGLLLWVPYLFFKRMASLSPFQSRYGEMTRGSSSRRATASSRRS